MLEKKRTLSLPRLALVLFCLGLSVVGCAHKSAAEVADHVADRITGGMDDAAQLSIAVTFYHGVNNKWPEDLDAVKAFCADKEGPFAEMDWSRYANANFQVLPDGRFKIDFHNLEQEPTQGRLDVSVILGPPVVKSDSAEP